LYYFLAIKIEDYDHKVITRDITNLFDSNLLSKREYEFLISLVKETPNIDDIEKLNSKLRDLYILRWNIDEIKCGYKVLRGNYKLYLDLALTQGSIVKLDCVFKSIENMRYVEITNFFLYLKKINMETLLH